MIVSACIHIPAVDAVVTVYVRLLAIDCVAAAGVFELFDDFRIATAIAHRATAASFHRFYGMYEF